MPDSPCLRDEETALPVIISRLFKLRPHAEPSRQQFRGRPMFEAHAGGDLTIYFDDDAKEGAYVRVCEERERREIVFAAYALTGAVSVVTWRRGEWEKAL